jgi:hypothetical protein
MADEKPSRPPVDLSKFGRADSPGPSGLTATWVQSLGLPGATRDELSDAVFYTRLIRLAAEAMWLAADHMGDTDIHISTNDLTEALSAINKWLNATDDGELRKTLLPYVFTVIRPISLITPPAPEALTAITTALSILNTHGLILATTNGMNT